MILKELLSLIPLKKRTLSEARKPGLTYTEKMVKKELDRVTVALEGSESGTMSRLTKRYERLDRTAKLLAEKRDEINKSLKVEVEEYFDAADELYTRVIDTISWTITLSKREQPKPPKKSVDYEAALMGLLELMPELQEKADELLKKFTTFALQGEPKEPGIRVKTKVNEGMMDKIKEMASSFLLSFKTWGKEYDAKLKNLKKMYA